LPGTEEALDVLCLALRGLLEKPSIPSIGLEQPTPKEVPDWWNPLHPQMILGRLVQAQPAGNTHFQYEIPPDLWYVGRADSKKGRNRQEP
jgi:hypothetical protein